MASHANSTFAPEIQALPPLPAIVISHLTGRDLMAVYDALVALDGAALGVANQPRCRTDRGLSAGGNIIEAIADWAGAARDAVVREAGTTVSQTDHDAEMCRWVAIKHHALCMGDHMDVASHAIRRLRVVEGGQC